MPWTLNKPHTFLLASDLHLDHPKCKRDLLTTHFKECIARDGYILLNGDTLCLMQGKYDKRHNKASVRPEDMTDRYFDSVVENGAEFLLPFAKRILWIGSGNHESSVFKRVEIDILRRMTDLIFYKTGHRIALGQYHGFLYLSSTSTGKTKEPRSRRTLSYTIYHNHGSGGDAPVTGGSIEDSRKMTHVEGVDAIWMGHNHNKYARQQSVMYLNRSPIGFLTPKLRIVDVIRSGTYKQEFTGHGWHIETGKAPKPLGGVWLSLTRRSSHSDTTFFESTITPTWTGEMDIDLS